MRRILFDLEGNGLLEPQVIDGREVPAITKVHCIHTIDIDNREDVRAFGPGEIKAALEYMRSADVLVGQNILRYDLPVLAKLHDFVWPLEDADGNLKALDLLVISRTRFPNIKELDGRKNAVLRQARKPTMPPEYFGSHTVGAWGWRLDKPKLHEDITDWSVYTPEMGERCAGDNLTTLAWWDYLKAYDDKLNPPVVLWLEHWIHVICEKMTQAGWPFDVPAAGELQAKLVERKHILETQLKERFGGWYKPKGKNATFTPKVNNKKLGYVIGQPCTRLEWVDFKPSSHQHIEKVLRKLGWEPKEDEYTEGGQAKTDEDILESLVERFPETEGLVEYLMVCKRLGALATGKQAWLLNVKPDGRIHANYNPMGTVVSRAAHFGPNIGQVPSVSRPYGPECRALFHVPHTHEQVGADMEGLELRTLAHYTSKYDGGSFGRDVLDGDPHWKNVIGFGFFPQGTQRDKENKVHTILREKGAKTGAYAICYGCFDDKLGTIILDVLRVALKADPVITQPIYEAFFGKSLEPSKAKVRAVGEKGRADFLENLPGLKGVTEKVERWLKGGTEIVIKDGKKVRKKLKPHTWLPGLDGRRVPSRSAHSAINALCSSAGAILCKRWVVEAYRALIADGLKWGWDGDFVFLGWVHDEIQIACRKGLGDRIGKIVVRCAQEAGTPYGFRIRLDSKYVIGRNWRDCH